MSEPLYSVGTYDWELGEYSPQEGLSVPCINVPLATVRQIFRELKAMGYPCNARDKDDGGSWRNDSDTNVLIERTDGKSEAEILEDWKR